MSLPGHQPAIEGQKPASQGATPSRRKKVHGSIEIRYSEEIEPGIFEVKTVNAVDVDLLLHWFKTEWKDGPDVGGIHKDFHATLVGRWPDGGQGPDDTELTSGGDDSLGGT